jgi:hypothetical protein
MMMAPMGGSGSLMILQCLACLAMLVGAFMLASWAAKTLTQGAMLAWAIGLLLGGAVVCALAMGSFRGSYGMPSGDSCPMMKDGKCAMMDDDMMMQGGMHDMHDMDSMDADDHMGMSMDDMGAMLEGKTGDAFDEAFLRMMIPHHQGAIDMVKNVETSAKHQEIKDLAKDIATAQQREIDMMNGWLQAWGYND